MTTAKRPPMPFPPRPQAAAAKPQLVEPASTGAVILPFRVLNLRHPGITKASGTYIGRPGVWGNPFSIGKDGTREEVIEQYRAWLLASTLMDNLHELKGCNLVCWCAPLACHGDILFDLANDLGRYRAVAC